MHTQDWAAGQKIPSHAEIFSDHVALHDVREFVYRTEQDCDKRYKDISINLDSLTGATYFVVPFNFIPGSAHVFVSFSFKDTEPIAISFEARRKAGQKFNPIAGLFNAYELIGIIGTERDVAGLRENIRKDKIIRYPLKLSQDKLQKFFISLLEKANRVNEKIKNNNPEFYNSLTNTCMTCLVPGFNEVLDKKISYGTRTVLPGYSANLFKNRNLISAE